MAGVILTCPMCNNWEWKQYDMDNHRLQCKKCGQWFSEEELNIEFIELTIE